METIYKVKKSTYEHNPKVEEIQIESKTNNFYKALGRTTKDAFETSYYKCFYNKQDAIEYMRQIRIDLVSDAKKKLKEAEENLERFNHFNPLNKER